MGTVVERYPGESEDIRQHGYVQCQVGDCQEITGPNNPDVLHQEVAEPLWECEKHTP
jgi:hypothetical protein